MSVLGADKQNLLMKRRRRIQHNDCCERKSAKIEQKVNKKE